MKRVAFIAVAIIVMIVFAGNFRAAFCAAKAAKKAPQAAAATVQKTVVPAGYVKANWKELYFGLTTDKGSSIYQKFHIASGDTDALVFEKEYANTNPRNFRIYLAIKGVFVNQKEPGSAVAEVEIIENGSVRFHGLMYQNQFAINPLRHTQLAQHDRDLPILVFTHIHPSITSLLQLNRLANKNDGNVYLQANNDTYVKSNDAGDIWNKLDEHTSSLDIDASNKNVFYAIRDRLIQKSMDAGKKWLTIMNGLPGNKIYREIIVNPWNSQEVFLLSNESLYSTADGGFTWMQTPLRGDVMQLIFNPLDKNKYYARTKDGVYLTKNAGLNWERLDDSLPKKELKAKTNKTTMVPVSVVALTYVKNESPYLLAITEASQILKSGDDGLSWKDIISGYNKEDGIYSIGHSEQEIYIGAYDCLYVLKNNSDVWEKISFVDADDQRIAGINGIYPLGNNNGYIIADRFGRIMHLDKNRNVRGLNYGVLPHSEILDLQITTINSKPRLIAMVNNKGAADLAEFGLYYSDNHGITWNNSFTWSGYMKAPYRLYVNPVAGQELILTGKERNYAYDKIYFSRDGGKNWQSGENVKEIGAPMIGRSEGMVTFKDDQIDANARYICNGNLHRLDKRTGNVIDLKVDAHEVAIAKDDNKKLFTDYVQMSLDGGWTWTDLRGNANYKYAAPLYFSTSEIVAFLYSCPGYKYEELGCSSARTDGAIMVSNDMGKTWSLMKNIEKLKTLHRGKEDADSLYAVYENDSGRQSRSPMAETVTKGIAVIQSLDKGKTWREIALYRKKTSSNTDLRPKISEIADGDKKEIYFATVDGLYKTDDNGISWDLLGGIVFDNPSQKKLPVTGTTLAQANIFEIAPDEMASHRIKDLPNRTILVNSEAIYNKVMKKTGSPVAQKKTKRRTKGRMAEPDSNQPTPDGSFTVDVTVSVEIAESGDVSDANLSTMDGLSALIDGEYKDRIYQVAKQVAMQQKFRPFESGGRTIKARSQMTIPVNILVMKASVDDLLAKAAEYKKSGDDEIALDYYNCAIETKSDYISTYINRGNLYLKQKNYTLALKDYDEAIRRDPTDPDSYNGRGAVRFNMKEYQQAVDNFSKAIELAPKKSMYYANRGNAYIEMQNSEMALKDIDKALDIDSEYLSAYYLMSSAYALQGKTDKACSYLKKGIKKGLVVTDEMKNDKSWDNLKKDECYKKIVAN